MTFTAIKRRITTRLGKVTGDDVYYHQLLIDAWKGYFDALADIEKNGLTIQTNQRAFVNPACGVKNEAFKQILKLQKHFGIVPRDRSQKDGENDEGMGDLLE